MARPPRFPTWHPIAARERQSSCVWEKLRWTEFPDAAYTPQQAMLLAKLGKLLIAHHHDDEFVTMMVKSPAGRQAVEGSGQGEPPSDPLAVTKTPH